MLSTFNFAILKSQFIAILSLAVTVLQSHYKATLTCV